MDVIPVIINYRSSYSEALLFFNVMSLFENGGVGYFHY